MNQNFNRFRVLPYKQGSRSAKALSVALGGKVLKLENSKFKPRQSDLIINWGNSHGISFYPSLVLNDSVRVALAANKLSFFNLMKDLDVTPQYWTNKEDIPDDAFPIVCRTVLSGHSGAGIVIANTRDDLADNCSLFVQYVKKKDEYRVHLGKKADGSTAVISVQRKARRISHENPNWQVRNLANGFVFVRDGVNPPAHCIELATKAFEASGLDFGAVDSIWSSHLGRSYVLEINTAPGLEGQTVDDYANFFKGFV